MTSDRAKLSKRRLLRISVPVLETYLREHGWDFASDKSTKDATVFRFCPDDRVEARVPAHRGLADYAHRIADVLQVVAEKEQRSIEQLLEQLELIEESHGRGRLGQFVTRIPVIRDVTFVAFSVFVIVIGLVIVIGIALSRPAEKAPAAGIYSPKTEDSVAPEFHVSGHIANIPDDAQVWIVTADTQGGQFWPKAPIVASTGEWEVEIKEEGSPTDGQLLLELWLVPSRGQEEIRRWLEQGDERARRGETKNLFPAWRAMPGRRLDSVRIKLVPNER